MALGASGVLILLMFVVKNFIETGAHVFYIPLLAFFLIQLILIFGNIKLREKPLGYAIGQWLGTLPVLGIWVPFIYTFFVVFSWDMPYAAVIMMVLLIPLLINVAPLIPLRWLLGLSVFFVFLGFIKGHLSSGYSEVQPLQTNLNYAVDLDNQKSFLGFNSRKPG